MHYEPLVDGLRAGSLVEIHGLKDGQHADFDVDANGQLGQLLHYRGSGDENAGKFHVHLTSGVDAFFDPANVRAKTDLKKPGEGGGERSFDMLLAPRTDAEGLGQEIATCLLEKGFCVLRNCQSNSFLESTLETLREMGDDGKLARLPEEVEEGYLGNTLRGKVVWLDGKNQDLAKDTLLWGSDGLHSHLAGVLQPYSVDVLDDPIDERTPAMVCLTLTDDEEPEYPSPEADDKALGTFLETWRRSLVRAVHFIGPATANVQLECRDTPKAAGLSKLQAMVNVEAVPNTILLFRPDIYDYSCECPQETLMTISNFLIPVPIIALSEIEGDTDWLKEQEGPPPPSGPEHIYVLNSVQRLPANFDNQWSYYSGLVSATDAVVKIPIMRGDVDPYFTSNEEQFETWQTTCCHQSYVEGTDMFDNKHFEISNAEAGSMDPVQRLLLECGAQSLALMGLSKKMCNRKSTHAGFAVGNDKLDWANIPKDVDIGGALSGTSTVLAIIANRFNFCFNLKGPSYVCDTACSASLTSTHCAKMMLKERQYDPLEWFLSMGAHLVLNAVAGVIGGTQSHMGGPIGRCLTFNASASGYLRGEGVSGIMMKWGNFKEESDAILRATQTGQDGRSASLTAPNGPAQEEMISRAIKEAHMTPPESTVWECHGTGTSLGDPIEVGAVRKVQIRMPRSEPLMITSNKTNIGHLEGGAAMAAICKCVLQCKHARCCSTLHLRTLNAHLEHAAFDAIFQSESACYAYIQGHSQVSSFGFGGTNGHGIFWGQDYEHSLPPAKAIQKKILDRPPPEVRVMGKNPDDWEADFPDWRNVPKDAKFTVRMGPSDVGQPLRYEIVEAGVDDDDDDTFYTISGNYNGWEDDKMEAGDIPGVHQAIVDVPSSGVLEFRFHKDADTEKVLCPDEAACERKTAPILGPAKDLTNKWVVNAPPNRVVTIELFIRDGKKSVMWLVNSR
mmetsp:Transcript_44821/g.116019  ORF Transcript_44821/g.116019 Transcript_44821/m.116019 type:complete len:957 (+) Transcript_44821:89-2959(+)